MIAIFKPVNNNPWYDLRELHIVKWKMRVKRYLKISDYIWTIEDCPVFKPLVTCNKKEYQEQFKDYLLTNELW